MPRETIASLKRQLANANDALEAALGASAEKDNNFFTGGLSALYDNRNAWERRQVFSETLRAWRVNPMAKRIVALTRSFVIGKKISLAVKPKQKTWLERMFLTDKDKATQGFLDEWWNDPLNDLPRAVKRWKDEDTRTGNLFILFSVAPNGMTYLRAIPSEKIEEIITAPNDIEQELRYTLDPTGSEYYEAYNPQADQKEFVLHFASNAPVGSSWGEPDFAALLAWLGRFATWMQDRARLNHFRSAMMYVLYGEYQTEQERASREAQLNANPPKPGSVAVFNAKKERLGILSATLDSFDASVDGLAMKKMIAAGAGLPLHYLAEPESTTRTTAEAAGTPTFRSLEDIQTDLFSYIEKIARVALQVRARVDSRINPHAEIEVRGPDITERDNAQLAIALARVYPPLADMYDRHLIDENQLLDISMRMIAEPFNGNAPKGKRKNLNKNEPPPQPEDPKVTEDPQDEQP